MKKKKISMTKARILKDWLTYPPRCNVCPFPDHRTCRLCKDSFPNLPSKASAFSGKAIPNFYRCPCETYSPSHVAKVAKRYVKDAGL